MKLEWVSFIFFGTAAAYHIYISFFKNRILNLCLAIGMIIGLLFVILGRREIAGLLVSFCGLSMIGAGLVLFFSKPKLRSSAYVQMVPPILGFFFLAFHIFSNSI